MKRRPRTVGKRWIVLWLGLVPGAIFLQAPAQEHASDIRVATFFSRFHARSDHYLRFLYAREREAGHDRRLRSVVDQMIGTELAILGRPGEAARRFPRGQSRLPRQPLPTATDYRVVPAPEHVAAMAAARRVVMVNEAHHLPQTRLLTLALLPRLRALGFTHFAVEGLDPADARLQARGYPTEASGFYVGEPVYAELVRAAIRLGYRVVAYEPRESGELLHQDRETAQAIALKKLLDADPAARLFVHAGYAHIDEQPGQLPPGVRPMAMELKRLTGVDPLSVDQTTLFLGDSREPLSAYRRLLAAHAPRTASVLVARAGGTAWSFRPHYHDATVLLPDPTDELRPPWLALDGSRRAVPIDASDCGRKLPCLVEVRHAEENNDAVPADQFLRLRADDPDGPLYLAPGRYRLRIRDDQGQVRSERDLVVADGG